jgi:hypothetical protein
MRKTLFYLVAAAMSLVDCTVKAQSTLVGPYYGETRYQSTSVGKPKLEVVYNTGAQTATAVAHVALNNYDECGDFGHKWVKVKLCWEWTDGCDWFTGAGDASEKEFVGAPTYGVGVQMMCNATGYGSQIFNATDFWVEKYESDTENGTYTYTGILWDFVPPTDAPGPPDESAIFGGGSVDLRGTAHAMIIARFQHEIDDSHDQDHRIRCYIEGFTAAGMPSGNFHLFTESSVFYLTSDHPWKSFGEFNVSNDDTFDDAPNAKLDEWGSTGLNKIRMKLVLERFNGMWVEVGSNTFDVDVVNTGNP